MNSALIKETNTRKLVISAAAGALYAVLTIVFAPISYGPLQFRVSEALCVMPFFVPESAIRLFVGCILANLYTGNIFDIIFGSLATLTAGILTAKAKKAWLACLWPVVSNGLIVGAVLSFAYGIGIYPVCVLEVALCEAAVMYAVGLPMIKVFENKELFKK